LDLFSVQDQETKGLRDRGTKRPRDQETERPRDRGTKRPRDQEMELGLPLFGVESHFDSHGDYLVVCLI